MIRCGEAGRRAAPSIELKVLPLLLLALTALPFGAASATPVPTPESVIALDAADALSRDDHAVLWIYFTDKGERDAASLRHAVAEAGARVSTASRARRARVTQGRFIPDATDVAVPDRYLRAVESAGARIRHASRWLNAASVDADARAAEEIAALPFVSRITRVLASVPQLDPPGDYGSAATQNNGVNGIAANDSGFTANGIVVAVFDTGFRKDHLALAPLKRIAEWDFVQSDGETSNQAGDPAAQWDHGTGVWSILGGYLPGTLVGPAYNGSFVLAKTKNVTSITTADEDRWVAAAEWADSIGVDIVQSSMVVQYPAGSLDGQTTPMALATNTLSRHGILVVTAMGNSGPSATSLWTPSDCDSILAVGSVTSANVISSFSSRGPTADGRGKPDVVAQGEGAVWAEPTCTSCIGSYPGTSLAAPLVSGIAALAMEAHPEWTPQQVRYAIKSTADKASTRDSTAYGWGRPNAVAAIYNSTLGPPIYPKPFALTAPAHDASQVAPPVTFRWRKSGDVNPGDVVSYAIEMKKVSNGAVIYSATTADTFSTYSGALENGTIYEWNVVATDLTAHARSAREALRFTSAGGLGAPPTASAPATAGGPEDQLITFGITANDPDEDPIWSLTGSPMPSGATLTPNGSNTSATFDWTPSYAQAGSYAITFTAANAFSGTASTTITVTNVNRAPTLDPIGAITLAPGATATRSLVASDPDGDPLTLSKWSGPAFAGVAGTTLTVSPGSGDTGSHTVVVRATDGDLHADQSVSVTVTTQAPPGLVAAFGFSEGSGTTTADVSVNGYTGTLVNSPTWTTGKYGNGLEFNATDDGNDSNDPRVNVGTTLNVPDLPFTFSVWVNPAGYADYRAIFSKRDSPGPANMRLDIGLQSGSGFLFMDAANNRSFAYSPPLDVWTHLTVVAEASGSTLYVNGVQQTTAGAISLGSKTTANVAIGGTGEPLNGDNDPFKGKLDDIRLYDRVLTPTEIQDDMNTGVGSVLTGVDEATIAPAASALRVYPNPFTGSARIVTRGVERIAVFDVAGRLVRTWKSASRAHASFHWDGSDHRGKRLPGGIYFVKAGRLVARVVVLR